MSYARKSSNNDWYQMALLRTFRTLGLMLLVTLGMLLLLSGCCDPIVIREKAPPYPTLPENLAKPPLNMDLGKKFLSQPEKPNSD